MSLVDMHCLYHNVNNAAYSEVDILEFSDHVCKKLLKRNVWQNARLGAMVGENNSGNKSILERNYDKDGNEYFKVTNNQAK